MKKYILAVLLCLSGALLFGQVLPCVYHQPGTELRFFEDRVRVRTSPNLNAEVLGLGKINEALSVLERDPIELVLDNVRAHWYKVRWNGKEGYVWGGLIANQSMEGDYDGDGKVETVLARVMLDPANRGMYGIEYFPEYMAIYTADFRLARANTLISDKPLALWKKSLGGINYYKNFDCKFASGIQLFGFGSGFGDGPASSITLSLFYLKDSKFIHLFNIEDESFDDYDRENKLGQFYVKTTIISTPEQHGRENVLIVEQTEKSITDGVETSNLLWRKIFFWNGKEFIELEK